MNCRILVGFFVPPCNSCCFIYYIWWPNILSELSQNLYFVLGHKQYSVSCKGKLSVYKQEGMTTLVLSERFGLAHSSKIQYSFITA